MKHLMIIALIISLASCRIHINNKTMDGNGNTKTESRNISVFKTVNVSGPINVTIKQGPDYFVQIMADENLMPYIITKKKGNELEIDIKDFINIRSKNDIKVLVQMPVVDELSVSGSGNINSDGKIENGNEIKINIGGSGNANLNIKTPKTLVSIGGSGDIQLTGETEDADFSIGGSGNCDAQNLKAENVKATVAGSGTIKLYCSQSLHANVYGSGDIFYAGNPSKHKIISKTGSGTVEEIK